MNTVLNIAFGFGGCAVLLFGALAIIGMLYLFCSFVFEKWAKLLDVEREFISWYVEKKRADKRRPNDENDSERHANG